MNQPKDMIETAPNLALLKSELDSANKALQNAVGRAVRGGRGPTEEMRVLKAVAMAKYRAYWAAVDAAKGGAS